MTLTCKRRAGRRQEVAASFLIQSGGAHPKTAAKREVLDKESIAILSQQGCVMPSGGEGQIPGFPSKNARSENRRKFLHRNGQRGGDGIPPEY